MPAPALGLTARAIVRRIVDGDTLDVELRLPVRIRLLDCWAPETRGLERDQGLRARQFLEALAPPGTHVRVNVPTGQADALGDVLTLGRVLGQVWCQDADRSVAEMMVAAGHALPSKPH